MNTSGAVWLDALRQDLRAALRTARKNPGLAAAVVSMLAIGTGASTTCFGLVNDVLWRGPPGLRSTDGLFVLSRADGRSQDGFTLRQYQAYRERLQSFSEIMAHRSASVVLREDGEPVRLRATLVSDNFFHTLQLRVNPGRDFRPGEHRTPGTHPVAIISHRLWQGRFRGDAAVIGRALSFRGVAFTVVGVAPPGFGSLEIGWGEVTDIWIPLMMEGQLDVMFPVLNSDLFASLQVIARLRPAVQRATAEAELAVASESIEQTDTKTGRRRRVVISPHLWNWRESDRAGAYAITGLLSGLAALVLVAACANVANLQLARAMERRRENAIRVALGSSRGQLLRAILAENLVLAFAAGGLGLWLGWLMTGWFWRTFGFLTAYHFDAKVVGFAFGLAAFVAFVTALIPAWRAAAHDLTADLKTGAAQTTRSRTPLQTLLLVAQVAASMVLLYGTALVVRTVQKLCAVDLGFAGENVLVVSVEYDLSEYREDRRRQVGRDFRERLAAQPGVVAASQAAQLPRDGNFMWNSPRVVAGAADTGSGQPSSSAEYNEVSPGYFATLGVPLRGGRDFDARDRRGAPLVAIVNEALARRLWRRGDAIGQRFRVPGPWDTPVYEVIGVAPDLRVFFREEHAAPQFYLPFGQGRHDGPILVRVANGAHATVAESARRVLREVDPQLPSPRVTDFPAYVRDAHSGERMHATIYGALGVVALIVSAFGLATLLMYDVAHRTREIGVRVALGATRGSVIGLVTREGMAAVLAGIAVGAFAAAGAAKFVASQLYGVSPFDGTSALGSALVVAGVSLAACWLPARRAARIDPLVALRSE